MAKLDTHEVNKDFQKLVEIFSQAINFQNLSKTELEQLIHESRDRIEVLVLIEKLFESPIAIRAKVGITILDCVLDDEFTHLDITDLVFSGSDICEALKIISKRCP